jgi:hypothetical protein
VSDDDEPIGKSIPWSHAGTSQFAAQKRDLIGRTITAVNWGEHYDGQRNKWIHHPLLTLDDGRAIWFVVEESDTGTYGTEICISPKPKPVKKGATK